MTVLLPGGCIFVGGQTIVQVYLKNRRERKGGVKGVIAKKETIVVTEPGSRRIKIPCCLFYSLVHWLNGT